MKLDNLVYIYVYMYIYIFCVCVCFDCIALLCDFYRFCFIFHCISIYFFPSVFQGQYVYSYQSVYISFLYSIHFLSGKWCHVDMETSIFLAFTFISKVFKTKLLGTTCNEICQTL